MFTEGSGEFNKKCLHYSILTVVYDLNDCVYICGIQKWSISLYALCGLCIRKQ